MGMRKKRDMVSCREYYCYKLQVRRDSESIVLRTGRLFQQYVVDMYVKLETSRLDYFRSKQFEIRSELFQGIMDSVNIGEKKGMNVGHRIILPASFIGGPRDMRKRYIDAMTLVQVYGKPDIFITMTCNPNWIEIKRELAKNEEVQYRPDLVARVFRAKVEMLKNELFKKEIFGEVAAFVYVIEFQKRGLPHAHVLIILKSHAKLVSVDDFDKIISAEIPDENDNPHLYAAVIKHMMHGPCGSLNSKNVCMKKNGKCKNHYPKSFLSNTVIGKDCYPLYRRRDSGVSAVVRKCVLDNRWVVPYNPYLLAKFDCHLNVEICSTIKAVKYLYKYVYKGHDRITMNINLSDNVEEVDEIKSFQSARWISPPEVMWRIYGFCLNEMYPYVMSLQVHLENKHNVIFNDSDNLQFVVNNDFFSRTMLTEFFVMNKSGQKSNKLLYREMPAHYVWNRQWRTWNERKQCVVVGRLVSVSPFDSERYYLRMLLNHVRGPTCFSDLRYVNGV